MDFPQTDECGVVWRGVAPSQMMAGISVSCNLGGVWWCVVFGKSIRRLVALLLGSLALSLCAGSPLRAASDGYETVVAGAVTYHIPIEYLPGYVSVNSLKAQSAFTIGLLLPDFRPATSDIEEFTRVGWHHQLRALVEINSHLLDGDRFVTQLLTDSHTTADDYTIQSGCRVYIGNLLITHELHVCALPDRFFFFYCSTRTDVVKFPSCHVSETISNNLSLIYDYSRDYLQDAIKIDKQLRGLIDSFVVGATPQH